MRKKRSSPERIALGRIESKLFEVLRDLAAGYLVLGGGREGPLGEDRYVRYNAERLLEVYKDACRHGRELR